MTTSNTVLKALARLQGSQDFEVVIGHVTQLRDEAIERMTQATDVILIGRAQGATDVLDQFLKLARDAEDILDKKRG